jgi:asparagine synthase (glutamine-hydrolysing)
VTPQQALDLIPELPHVYDEPFADSSQVPSLLLARLTRAHVTVALSGDGGDEAFAGYNRHVHANLLAPPLAWMPAALRRGVAALLDAPGPARWDRLGNLLPAVRRPRELGDKIGKVALVLRGMAGESHRRLLCNWPDAARYLRGNHGADCLAMPDTDRVGRDKPGPTNPGEQMQLQDTLIYLPDDVLVKVDRATMDVALECRVPLLDHRVVEFGWRLPWRMRVRGLTGKWIARQVLRRYVPPHLFERPKTGFTLPLADWLRGGLRDWAEAMLAPARLDASGVLDAAAVRSLWQEHLDGRRNRQHALWNVLMFQAWHERWRH